MLGLPEGISACFFDRGVDRTGQADAVAARGATRLDADFDELLEDA